MHHRPPGKLPADQDRRVQLLVRQALRNPCTNSQPAPETNADVAAVNTPWLGRSRCRYRWYKSRPCQPAVERFPEGEVGTPLQNFRGVVFPPLAYPFGGRNCFPAQMIKKRGRPKKGE